MSEKSIYKELGISAYDVRRQTPLVKAPKVNLPTHKDQLRLQSKKRKWSGKRRKYVGVCAIPKCKRWIASGDLLCYKHWNGAK